MIVSTGLFAAFLPFVVLFGTLICLFVCLLACLLLTPEFCDNSQPTRGTAISRRTGRTEPITKPGSALESRPPTTKATSVRGVPESKTNPVWVELEVGSMHRVEVKFAMC